MKRLISYLLLYIALLCSCSKYETNETKPLVVKATEIKLDINLIVLHPGDPMYKLKAVIFPKSSKDTITSWVSTNNVIAEVKDGEVKALKLGKCYVVAKIENRLKSICEVRVEPVPILVNSIKIEHDDYKIKLNEEFDIKASFLPENATYKDYLIKIEKNDIVSLKDGNKFLAKAEGKTKVIFTSISNYKIADTCQVEILSLREVATGIKSEFDTYTVPVGGHIRIKAGFFPANPANIKYHIEISDYGILDIEDSDIFIGRNPGVAIVTFTSELDETMKTTCIVTVPNPEGLTDQKDGKKYKTVTIGNQEWMAENYAYLIETDYADNKNKISSWNDKLCYVYENTDLDYISSKHSRHYKKYGAFYNYVAAVAYAPKGWHLPTNKDWIELQKFLGMSDREINRTDRVGRGDAFNRLKEPGSWAKVLKNSFFVSDSANNQTGWSARAAGYGHYDTVKKEMIWDGKNHKAYWWAVEDGYNPKYAVVEYGLYSASSQLHREELYKYDALSVRYVKDK
ncbi:MAG: fibrobacter succinogenes major paralogous domain-containing protein [Marinifilaceae bacterium]